MVRKIGWGVMTVLTAGMSACGSGAQQRQASVDTAEAAPDAAPATTVNQLPPTRGEGSEYIVHGVCPFECCKYGDWTMLNGGALRTEPNGSADSVGSVTAGATVRTDSGVMVLNPTGVAVIVSDTASTPQSGPRVGDTVEVISYAGQKVTRVRWNGNELDKTDGVQILRDPVQRWWVHVTDPSSLGGGGWMMVNGVSAEMAGAPNSCSHK